MALCLDRDGRLWAGTEDEGILRGEAPSRPRPAGPLLRPEHRRCGPAGRSDTRRRLPPGETALGDDNGYALACDKLGRIWVGHRNHGVSVYDGRDPIKDGQGGLHRLAELRHAHRPVGRARVAIQSCPIDGDVWIATSAGLSRYSLGQDTCRHYTRGQGMPADVAELALAFDPKGNLVCRHAMRGLLMAPRDPASGAKQDLAANKRSHPSAGGACRSGLAVEFA